MRHFRRAWAIPVMLLFWFHPLNLLSVAWIVQFKTVLCGFLFILSLHAGLRFWRTKKKSYYVASFLLFTLSVFSKSSVLPFPWIALLFLVYQQRKIQSRQLYLLPFLLITLFSTWRIYTNDMVQERVAESKTIVDQKRTVEAEPEPEPMSKPEEEFEGPCESDIEKIALQKLENNNDPNSIGNVLDSSTPKDEKTILQETPPADTEAVTANIETTNPPVEVQPIDEEPKPDVKTSQALLIVQTLGEYILKPFFTYPLAPIHGSFSGKLGAKAYLGYGLALALILFGMFKKSKLALFSIVAIVLGLVPFIGFIIAPYMTYSYISEQHYYLVLPFFIMIQLWLISLLPKRFQTLTLVSLWFLLSFQTVDYAAAFKNDKMYFERVLSFHPTDRISQLSLAAHFAHNGQPKRALNVVENALSQARKNPKLEKDPLHPLFLRAREFYAACALSQ
ncbi:MAG: hypothetical protein K2P81_13580 [Bacteriovoracaceae bacterium]|nr:hypothetical protein [Bacteriovoracaceae bacterium]